VKWPGHHAAKRGTTEEVRRGKKKKNGEIKKKTRRANPPTIQLSHRNEGMTASNGERRGEDAKLKKKKKGWVRWWESLAALTEQKIAKKQN